jgi:integrase
MAESLERHVLPLLGDVLVRDLNPGMVQSALAPIWTSHLSASRIRQRLERVIAYADVQEQRDRTNPAEWKNRQRHLLPAPAQFQEDASERHHRALPCGEAPALLDALAADHRAAARPLAFLLFTACRTSEVLGAVWGEVDDDEMIWTIPGTRMKTKKKHRVPLVPEARAILGERRGDDDPIFPSPLSPRWFLSKIALRQWLERRGWLALTTVHGLRACFRTWASERTTVAHEVAEGCLAHKVGSEVERRYIRDDMLERRRALLRAWAAFLTGADAGDKVLSFKRA